MANLNQILKEEMGRVARRELKPTVDSIQRQLVDLRRTVRDQRRQIEELEAELALKADRDTPVIQVESLDEEQDVRVPTGSVKKHRERLGITQREMGQLLDVSTLTVSNWELGKSNPRGKNKLAFAELRRMGVRDVRQRLERLNGEE